MQVPFFLAITGKSGSGKSLLAKSLHETLPLNHAQVFTIDSYYRDLSHLAPADRNKVNFDIPEAIDWDLLTRQLNELKQGRRVDKPVYDFSIHCRSKKTDPVDPCDVLIIEGLFSLEKRIRDFMDAKIFLEAPDGLALERRIKRDQIERGRNSGDIRMQFWNQVAPAYEKYIKPCREYADLVLDGGAPIETSVARIIDFFSL